MKGQGLTQFSTHANVIADTVRAAFAKSMVGSYRVEMTAPHESTKGGLLALQHVMFKPAKGMALVVGTVNAAEKRAELRSYAQLAKVNQERFKCALAIDDPAYSLFLEKLEGVLTAFGIETEVTEMTEVTEVFGDPALPSVAPTEAAPVRESRPSRLMFFVLLVLALLVCAGVWFALHR